LTRCAQRTELANEDLRAIALQIGLESGRVVTGARIIDELIDCCDRIAALPVGMVLGSAAPELGTGVRLFHHRRWVLIFRYLDTGILVLRIVDGSQDYSSWKLDQ
jgi:plasmid stabilization system protein ParE